MKFWVTKKTLKSLRRYWPILIAALMLSFGFPLLGKKSDLVWWSTNNEKVDRAPAGGLIR